MENGIVVRLKLVRSHEDYRLQRYERVDISLNVRQLRSFTRDLTRASHEQGIQLEAVRPHYPSIAGLRRLLNRLRRNFRK